MSNIFHKDKIFEDASRAWSEYRCNPERFAFPERVTVELTNHCNLNCGVCPRNKADMVQGYMDFTVFKKIIDEMSQYLPVGLVPFFRGEALLHPDFANMLRYANAKKIKPIQISSNATLLTEKLAKEILDLEIDSLSFSIHADAAPAKGQKGLICLLEEKKRRNRTLPNIQISRVKTKENSESIDDFVRYWRNKADRVRIYHAHSLDGRFGHIANDSIMARRPCLKLLTDMVVYWNGDIAICNHDWQRKTLIGNVTNSPLEDIWRNESYEGIRKKHLDGDHRGLLPCEDCSHWKAYYNKENFIGEIYENQEVPVS